MYLLQKPHSDDIILPETLPVLHVGRQLKYRPVISPLHDISLCCSSQYRIHNQVVNECLGQTLIGIQANYRTFKPDLFTRLELKQFGCVLCPKIDLLVAMTYKGEFFRVHIFACKRQKGVQKLLHCIHLMLLLMLDGIWIQYVSTCLVHPFFLHSLV